MYMIVYFRQVLEVMAGARGEDPVTLAEAMYENTMRLFFPSDSYCQQTKKPAQ